MGGYDLLKVILRKRKKVQFRLDETILAVKALELEVQKNEMK